MTPFRWESRCLSDDPFAWDFGDGEVLLANKMVTNRKGGTCHHCAGECEPGTRNRVIREACDGSIDTYRFCQSCSFGMAVYDIRPSILDARIALGDERRARTALASLTGEGL